MASNSRSREKGTGQFDGFCGLILGRGSHSSPELCSCFLGIFLCVTHRGDDDDNV